MTLHIVLLIAYSVTVVGLGIWLSRYVRGSSAFFVGGRALGPGLMFSTMLAANIGAASTVGAAGKAYSDGLATWWWVGSAGIGSLVFAATVAPALWRLARTHDFYTTGDYLEFRYGPTVRGVAALVICLASLTLLAGQLIAGGTILNVLVGIPFWVGALVAGAIMTVYFSAGGLFGSAWINGVQLLVMMAGFLAALPFVLEGRGGLTGVLHPPSAPATFSDPLFSSGPGSGWMYLLVTGPSFMISPGLIQKAYGAKSERALRTGIALNGLALMLFGFLPVLFGMAARGSLPGIEDPNQVLPLFLKTQLPVWIGALALAAVFSTEVDTCDTILFMLSTTLSKDLYKRHINPAASDRQLLRVARMAAVAGGAAGVGLSLVLGTVLGAVLIFYQVMVVSLFVPILAGLYVRRADERAALASIGAGLAGLFLGHVALRPAFPWADPILVGVGAAVAAFVVVFTARGAPSPPSK